MFNSANLTSVLFVGADLTGADLTSSTFTSANFTDAIIRNAVLAGATQNGFKKEHLYSTANYKAKDITGVSLKQCNVSGWDFSGQDMRGAYLDQRLLMTADIRFMDFRGGQVAYALSTPFPKPTDFIYYGGSIYGLGMDDGDEFVIRNDPIGINVRNSWSMADGAMLKMVFDNNPWGSVMSAADAVIPDIGGTLYMEFAEGTDIASLVGHEFQLFNWNGKLVAGDHFDSICSIPGVAWDTSRLYTEGIVELTSVPEPMSLMLLGLGAVPAIRGRKKRR